jgi:hypothetical protein
VIGNLREVAEGLAPGRACISVVSDHGSVKDRGAIEFIPGFPGGRASRFRLGRGRSRRACQVC